MRRAALTVITLAAAAACSMAETQPGVTFDAGTAFQLKPGQVAALRDGRLRLGFDAVTGDSRCPKGEKCVWAGDATLRLWIEPRGGAREMRELHTSPRGAQALPVLGQELRLLALDPYPVSGKAIAPADYVATLSLAAPAPAAAPER